MSDAMLGNAAATAPSTIGLMMDGANGAGTASAPASTSPPPVGLMSEPMGNVATEQPGTAVFPSTSFEGADWFGLTRQVARSIGNAQAEFGATDDYGRQVTPSEQPISADDANKQFGIPGKLSFSAPVPASVAQSMNDAKTDEMAREDAAARAPAGFWPTAARMGAGFVAGALDPLNVAAAFVPALGESRVAGALARAGVPGLEGVAEGGAATIASPVGRAAFRSVEGYLGNAAGIVPLTALRYGLSQQEQGDYSAMDALADSVTMPFLGAALHAGGGLVGDVLGQRFARSAAGAAVVGDPDTAEAAMRTAVAATVEGRPVEVGPVLDAGLAAHLDGGVAEIGDLPGLRAARPVSLVDFLIERGGVQDQGGDLGAMDADLIHHRAGGRLVSDSGMPLDYAKEAAEEAGYLPQNSTTADLLDKIGDAVSGRNSYRAEDQAQIDFERSGRSSEAEQGHYDDAHALVLSIADEHGVTLQPEEAHQAAIMTMQGVHPEDALIEATRGTDIDAGVAFDRATSYAQGEPLPEEIATRRMADAAAAETKPDLPGGLPASADVQTQLVEEALQRADEAGLLSEAERAEMTAADSWLDQAAAFGKGVLQAAACIARGLG